MSEAIEICQFCVKKLPHFLASGSPFHQTGYQFMRCSSLLPAKGSKDIPQPAASRYGILEYGQ
jgi:hypothetical protein